MRVTPKLAASPEDFSPEASTPALTDSKPKPAREMRDPAPRSWHAGTLR